MYINIFIIKPINKIIVLFKKKFIYLKTFISYFSYEQNMYVRVHMCIYVCVCVKNSYIILSSLSTYV